MTSTRKRLGRIVRRVPGGAPLLEQRAERLERKRRWREHYWSRAYNTKERTCSFWHQVDEILELGAGTVLEVGAGAGLVTDWLRRAGVTVTTLDSEDTLKPDAIGSVTEIPFPDDSFDAVLCCQVLEHMPFEQAERGLGEMRRVARSGVVISLPDTRPWLGIAYPIYYGYYTELLRQLAPSSRRAAAAAILRRDLRLRDYLFTRLVPEEWGRPGRLRGRVRELRRPPIPHGSWRLPPGDEHVWEIGMEGFPLERIFAAFERAELEMAWEFRVPENPWHHFFTMRPS